MIRSGRQQIGPVTGAQPAAYTRPTLVAPSAATRPAHPRASARRNLPRRPRQPPSSSPRRLESTRRAEALGLTCFRLEFESRPGPLDLRTVDDAVSEHPAVRDVALLDYDGRKATLKVWIDGSASSSDVQSTLVERSAQLFGAGNDVTIVALEDAA